MTEQPLLFTPDRRSVQGTSFRFSEHPGKISYRDIIQKDSLVYQLNKIYETKFKEIEQSLRSKLVDYIVSSNIPLIHKNLTLLAAANWILYSVRSRGVELTPEIFSAYFEKLASQILGEVTGKTSEEVKELRLNFKISLLRYIFYLQSQLNKI